MSVEFGPRSLQMHEVTHALYRQAASSERMCALVAALEVARELSSFRQLAFTDLEQVDGFFDGLHEEGGVRNEQALNRVLEKVRLRLDVPHIEATSAGRVHFLKLPIINDASIAEIAYANSPCLVGCYAPGDDPGGEDAILHVIPCTNAQWTRQQLTEIIDGGEWTPFVVWPVRRLRRRRARGGQQYR